jgi:FkbM family methyltransferase
MLISFEESNHILLSKHINIIGSFHIGANNCEELSFYNNLGIKNEDIVWIDANPSKVNEAINRGIPNVYNAVITDKDDEVITVNISNNVQSQSILEFDTQSQEDASVVYVDKIQQTSITIDTFFERNNIDASKYNFWNFDIQGSELMALKGAIQSIKYAKAIYLDVKEIELYKNRSIDEIKEIDLFLSNYNFKRVLTKMTSQGCGMLYIFLDNYTF